MNSLYFYYNGRKSEDLGVYLVSVESGLKSTPFLAEKQLISESIAGNDTPYVFGHQKQPLVFTLTLACLEEKWTMEKRREIARWLDVGKFEEFYTTDDINKRLYLQYIASVDLTHNGMEEGYIQVQMQNISPYAYSPYQQTKYNLSDIISPTTIEIENNGDDIVKPELWIYKVGNGDLTIKNLSNSGQEFKFTGLHDKETVYIDNQRRDIETDIPLTYRYDSFNNNYMELVRGINRLEVTGACILSFKFQSIIKG